VNAGRIDVHSHLLPGVDDGCESAEESIACARELVAAGYTHSFCTPHVTPGFPQQTIANVARWVAELQQTLTEADVPLTLLPGGEINLWPDLTKSLTPPRLLTYGGMGRACLVDIWADKLPDYFEPAIRWLQARGLRVILGHPERMKAVQADPKLADYFLGLGLLLQGNLQCLSDPIGSPTRVTVERFLKEGRYFLLGSDLHRLETLHARLEGLGNAIEMAGEKEIDRLTKENPKMLLG
jgi:protein-tyrosine phosphatase